MNATSLATLPQSIEAEMSVLGAVLIDPDAMDVIGALLLPVCFYRESYGAIFAAMLSMREHGKPIDLVTLSESLRAAGQLDGVGGMEALSNIMSAVPSSANVLHYARIIREHHARRETIRTAHEITASGGVLPIDEIAAAMEERLASLYSLDDTRAAGMTSAKEALRAVYAEFGRLNALARDNALPPTVDTGIDELDALIGGFPLGYVTILGARPGLGKTSSGLQFAVRAAARQIPTAVFALEMPTADVMRRIMSQETGIDEDRLRRAALYDPDYALILPVAERITKMPLWIDDRDHTIGSMCAEIRRVVRVHGVRFVIVDYLQLVKSTGRNREEEVASVSGRLRVLSRELKLHVLVLAQLNRDGERGTEMREPRLGSIRESGSAEQDAALVIFLHGNPQAEDKADREKRTAIVAKARFAQTGRIPLRAVKGTRLEYFRDEKKSSSTHGEGNPF